MNFPERLFYSKTHQWLRFLDDDKALVGITDYAQDSMGSLVFVTLPEVGDAVQAGEAFGDVESVKTVSDVYSPVTGTVDAVNQELLDTPEAINESPYESWLITISDISQKEELMSSEEYAAYIKEQN